MKKKILAIVLSMIVVLTLFPAYTFAAPSGTPLSGDLGSSYTISEDGSYYLSGDVTGNITIAEGKAVTLDLNGYVLKGTGTYSVISNYGSLTITDSDTTTAHYFTYSATGAWTLNTTATQEEKESATSLKDVSSETTDGTLVKISGGVITGGNRNGTGGGVFMNAGCQLVMNGGTICGNTATEGGGLYTGNTVSVTIENTSIVGNYATKQFGGGLLNVNNSSITVGGNVNIFANTAAADNNLTLWDADKVANPITINSNNPLTQGSKISLSLKKSGQTVAGTVTNANSSDYSSCFASDDASLKAYNTGSGAAQVVKMSKHEHTWSYGVGTTNATNDTLKAWCSETFGATGNCSYSTETNAQTIVIQASNSGYDGTAKAATLSGTTFGELTVSASDIEYEGVSPTTYAKSKTAPTNAGLYKASITVGEGEGAMTAYVEYGISPAQIVVKDSWADSKTYDGTPTAEAHIGTISGIYDVDKANVTVAIQSATFDDKNVGTQKIVTITYSVSGSAAGNYAAPNDSNTSAGINPREISVVAENKTSYVGSELEKLTYTSDDLCSGDTFTGELATNAGKNAVGTYDITQNTLKVNDGNNGNNYTINYTKGTYTVTAKIVQTLKFDGVTDDKVTKTYGDAAFTETASGAKTPVTYSSSDTSVATVDEKTGKVTIIKAGKVTITATAEESATYAAGTAQYVLTVSKIKVDIPEAKTGLVYNGKKQTGVELPKDALYTLTDNAQTNAGDYKATASLKDKDNYEWNGLETTEDQLVEWKIEKAKVVVTAENKTSYVGSELEKLTYTSDDLCSGDSFTGELATNANKNVVGTSDITQNTLKVNDGNNGNNYTINYTKGTYTVSAKEIQTLTFAGVTGGNVAKTYGDEPFTETVTGAETKVTYSSSDTSVATVDEKTGKVTIIKAGKVEITATAEESATYAAGTAQYVLTVSKIKVDIPEAKTGLVYNGKQQTGVEFQMKSPYKVTGNVQTDAGDYKAVASLDDKDNYEWKELETSEDQLVEWKIEKAKVVVTAEDKTMFLGNKIPELTAKITGLVGADKVTYNFNMLKPDAQGVYSIVPSGDAVQENYDVSYVNGKLTVTKKESDTKANSEDVNKVLENYESKEEYKGKILDIEVRTNQEVPEKSKTEIQKVVSSEKKIQFTETSLYLITKSAGKTEEKNIGDENDTLIEITYKFDFDNKKNIQVFRGHENSAGEVTVDELTEKANASGEFISINKTAGEITVKAKKFSTFAFAYDYAVAPNTGDTTNIWLYVIIGALAVLVLAGAVVLIKKSKKSK